jgi:hypothetical protein
MKIMKMVGISLGLTIIISSVTTSAEMVQAAGCSSPGASSSCPSPSPVANGSRQEVPNGLGVTQKKYLQQQGSTPSPSASGKATPNRASRKDWGFKVSMTCGKGAVTLHLKKIGKCPRGFSKIK